MKLLTLVTFACLRAGQGFPSPSAGGGGGVVLTYKNETVQNLKWLPLVWPLVIAVLLGGILSKKRLLGTV